MIANLGMLVNIVCFLCYLAFSPDRTPIPKVIVFWAWLPTAVYFVLHHFFDGVQNTTRNIARIYLLTHHGRNYDASLVPSIQFALIPNNLAILTFIWQAMAVVSFVCLLFYQGWLLAVLSRIAVWGIGLVTPINYQSHLLRIQSYLGRVDHPQRVIEFIELARRQIDIQDIADLVDAAIRDHRNPQNWWTEVLRQKHHESVE